MRIVGDIGRAAELISSILKNQSEDLHPDEILMVDVIQTSIFLRKFEYEQAGKNFKKIFTQLDRDEDIKSKIMAIWMAMANSLQFNYYLWQDDFEKSIVSLEHAIKIAENHDLEGYTPWLYNNLGVAYSEIGNLELGETLINKSLNMALEVENSPLCCQYGSLSEIHMRKGDLNQAVKYGEDGLKIVLERCTPESIACYQEILGNIHFKMGNNQRATELIETGQQTRMQIQSFGASAHDLRDLVRIELDQNNLDKAKFYFEKLSQLENQHPNIDRISYFCQFSEALILMQSKRAVNIGKSQEIFTKLLKFSRLGYYEKIDIYLNLSSLLIHELKIEDDEEVVDELESTMDRVLEIASELKSKPLLAEIISIRAKVALIRGDIDTALELVEQAKSKVVEISQARLYDRIESFETEIKNNYLEWKKIVASNSSIREKIEKSMIENYIASSLKVRYEVQYYPT
ncbi:MAG: hypothetical protein IH840_14890 [Candidatus Heimdallarchaeota archaeon]|nr:hypothetical protein [Candidatus Heimdallarchaeota archaeon]